MKTKEEIKQEIDNCLRMIISNSDAIIGDETLTDGQISNLHLSNKIIESRIETLGWVIGEKVTFT
jgi:hypothetical protein